MRPMRIFTRGNIRRRKITMQKGLTLSEIMITILIMAVVVVGIFKVLQHFQSGQKTSQTQTK
jgi:prepilin-type N-terminal cleavage/methylation domain-containing protein